MVQDSFAPDARKHYSEPDLKAQLGRIAEVEEKIAALDRETTTLNKMHGSRTA